MVLRRHETAKFHSILSAAQCYKYFCYLLIASYLIFLLSTTKRTSSVGGKGTTLETKLGATTTKNKISLDAAVVGAPHISSQVTTHHDTQLGASQSYGFFDDVPLKSWQLLRDIYMQVENHREPDRPLLFSDYDPPFPDDYNPGYRSAHAWWGNNYEPNFSCQFEKRIGGNGDGPKWVCDPHRIRKLALERKIKDPNSPGCIVYSIGSNGNFLFELALQKEIGEGICEFHIFDMGDFKGQMPAELQRAYYHQWGLKKQGAEILSEPESRVDYYHSNVTAIHSYFGLHDMIKYLGHEKLDVIDIFKIDCEGCEWETYQDWLGADMPLLHQILVEVHGCPESVLDFMDSFEKVGYLRYHKEPNIQSDPSCLELGMIKVSKDFMDGKKYTFNKTKYFMENGNLVEGEW